MTDVVVLDAKPDITISIPKDQNTVYMAPYLRDADGMFLGYDSEQNEFWLLQGKIVKVTREEPKKKP